MQQYTTVLNHYFRTMENLEQRWAAVQNMLEERFGKIPDMEGILFLVGVNELGALPSRKFSKEQKQDLMHIAVCSLLSHKGYFKFYSRDEDGWPHYTELMPVPIKGMQEQEDMLKECIVAYFE